MFWDSKLVWKLNLTVCKFNLSQIKTRNKFELKAENTFSPCIEINQFVCCLWFGRVSRQKSRRITSDCYGKTQLNLNIFTIVVTAFWRMAFLAFCFFFSIFSSNFHFLIKQCCCVGEFFKQLPLKLHFQCSQTITGIWLALALGFFLLFVFPSVTYL